jgi:alpha-N-acetylglucosaminidase
MANYSKVLQQQFAVDFKKHDREAFKRHTLAYLQLIDDIDALMATRKDFLLGKWLNDAKACGNNAYEKKLYEQNARDLITLWGGKDASLHDYGTKQWSGLFKGIYKKRWELFIDAATLSLNTGRKFNPEAVDEKVKAWEWQWVNSNELYPDKTQGDPVAVSRAMYKKYAALIAKKYSDNPQFTKN